MDISRHRFRFFVPGGGLPPYQAPKYVENNLTGGWIANDGGSYYIRQINNVVWWVGHSLSFSWCNVFRGSLQDGSIQGDWADVIGPNDGMISLKNTDSQVLDRTNVTGNFSGSRWRRADRNTQYKISFVELECVDDTDEWNDDEPYIVTFTADFGPMIPTTLTRRSSVFEGDLSMEAGDTRSYNMRIWGTQLKNNTPVPAAIPSRADVIMLVALVENDSSSPDSVKAAVQAALTPVVFNLKQTDADRPSMVKELANAMKGAIELGAGSGGIDMDELLDIDELFFTSNDVQKARVKGSAQKTLTLVGDDGIYKARFLLRPRFKL